MLLHRDTLALRYCLRSDAFTQKCLHTQKHFYTQTLLHRDDFALGNVSHRCHYKDKWFYKGMQFTGGAFTYWRSYTDRTDILLHDCQRQTCMSCERLQQASASRCKSAISPQLFNDRDACCAKGLRIHEQNRNVSVFLTNRNAFSARASTQNHPSKRKKKTNFTSISTIETLWCEKGHAKPSKR